MTKNRIKTLIIFDFGHLCVYIAYIFGWLPFVNERLLKNYFKTKNNSSMYIYNILIMFYFEYICVYVAYIFGWIPFVNEKLVKNYLKTKIFSDRYEYNCLKKLDYLDYLINKLKPENTKNISKEIEKKYKTAKAISLAKILIAFYSKKEDIEKVLRCRRYYITFLWYNNDLRKALIESNKIMKFYDELSSYDAKDIKNLSEILMLKLTKSSILTMLSHMSKHKKKKKKYTYEAVNLAENVLDESKIIGLNEIYDSALIVRKYLLNQAVTANNSNG